MTHPGDRVLRWTALLLAVGRFSRRWRDVCSYGRSASRRFRLAAGSGCLCRLWAACCRRAIDGVPDIGELLQLSVGESVQEQLAHALEVGPVRFLQAGSASARQDDVEAPRVVFAALAHDEALALELVHESTEATGAHENLLGERRDGQPPAGGGSELDQDIVIVARELM